MKTELLKLEKLEREIACSETRQDPARLFKLLADDFEEVGASGRKWQKEDMIEMLITSPIQKVELSDFKFKVLSENAVLLKYQSQNESSKARRCSIWVKSNNGWQIIYHQGTCEKKNVNIKVVTKL